MNNLDKVNLKTEISGPDNMMIYYENGGDKINCKLILFYLFIK